MAYLPTGSSLADERRLLGEDRPSRDPDDDHVLACSIAAKADLIVSGDKDLVDLHKHQGIPILPPADTLQQLQPAKP